MMIIYDNLNDNLNDKSIDMIIIECEGQLCSYSLLLQSAANSPTHPMMITAIR